MRLSLFKCFLSIAGPLFEAPGDGRSGGAGAGATGDASGGRGAGAPAGGPSSGAPSGGAAAGAAGAAGAQGTPYRLTDDSVVDLGDGRTGRWGEIRGQHFMDRATYDRGVQYLESVAADLDTRQQQLLERMTAAQRGQRPDGSALPASDPFAELEGLPLIDGKTLAKYARQLTTNGFGQIAQTVASLATRLQKIEQANGQLSQHAGRQTEREAEEGFARFVSESLAKVGPIQGLPDGLTIPTDSPFLADVARDLWSSHDPNSWRNVNEFHKMLGERISAMIGFVRDLDKRAIKQGEERRRRFLNPNRGSATPKGEAPYRHMRGDELAAMLHRNVGPTT